MKASHGALIFNVCDTLRTASKHQNAYLEMANKAAVELNLEERLKHLKDFGKRDTFSFEEESFLLQFLAAAEAGEIERAREIAAFRLNSVWAREAERMLLWTIAERGLELISKVDESKPEWKKQAGDLTALISYYTERLRQLDTLHRVFEQAVNDAYGELGCGRRVCGEGSAALFEIRGRSAGWVCCSGGKRGVAPVRISETDSGF